MRGKSTVRGRIIKAIQPGHEDLGALFICVVFKVIKDLEGRHLKAPGFFRNDLTAVGLDFTNLPDIGARCQGLPIDQTVEVIVAGQISADDQRFVGFGKDVRGRKHLFFEVEDKT